MNASLKGTLQSHSIGLPSSFRLKQPILTNAGCYPDQNMNMQTSNAATDAERLEQIKARWEAQRKHFPLVQDMPAERLHSRITRKADHPGSAGPGLVIVDVRTADEQQVSMLPGPTITKEEFEQHEDDYKQHDVVCYCTIGMRSGQFAKELCERGFNASNLEHSILGWTHHHLPLVLQSDRSRETRRVHVFGKDWELQATDYDPVTFKRPFVRAAWGYLSERASALLRPGKKT